MLAGKRKEKTHHFGTMNVIIDVCKHGSWINAKCMGEKDIHIVLKYNPTDSY